MKPVILKLARDDLKTICKELSEFGVSLPKKFRESFEKFCNNVESMPYMYSQYEHNPEYRRAVIAFSYIVFYKIEENINRAKIHRILHGKRNIVTMLD